MWLWTDLMSFSGAPLDRHELEMDRQEMLADDVEAGGRQQMVDVGDAAGERILDRDHGELGLALLDRGEAVLEGRAGHGLVVGIDLLAGEVGVGSGLALEHDLLETRHGFGVAGWLLSREALAGAERKGEGDQPAFGGEHRPRPGEVGGRVDAERHGVDDRDVDPHAGFERPELLELLAHLERRGRQADVAGKRRAAIGVEADVVVERPVAPRRGGAGEIEGAEPAVADRACRRP